MNEAVLEDRLEEMRRYYKDGIVSRNTRNIAMYATSCLIHPDSNEYIDEALNLFYDINEHYAVIPFEKLQGKNEFIPLVKIRKLLLELEEVMHRIFKDKVFKDRDEFALPGLIRIIKYMQKFDREYKETLDRIWKQK